MLYHCKDLKYKLVSDKWQLLFQKQRNLILINAMDAANKNSNKSGNFSFKKCPSI